MQTASVNGVDLAYEINGDGEPVLLIHGAILADAMRPLAEHPSLEGFTTVWYHRRGYGESTGGPADVPTHAQDARVLLERLGLAPAHVIGHSYGGSTAMELAAASPESVRSIALLEPGLLAHIPSAARVQAGMTPIVEPYMQGDPDEAIHRFSRTVLGTDYESVVSASLGVGALDQAKANANACFEGDLASLGAWSFDAARAAAIGCPVLVIVGADSGEAVRMAFDEFGIEGGDVDLFAEMVEVTKEWLPAADVVRLSGINHALQIADAGKVAEPVAAFLAGQRAVLT